MKTIGLIGGMSWESTQVYYRLLNENVKQRLGGHHSAKVVLVSVDFAEIAELQHAGDWQATAAIFCARAQKLLLTFKLSEFLLKILTKQFVVLRRLQICSSKPINRKYHTGIVLSYLR